jgi:TrbC/VIRB2 pilin
MKQTRTVVNQAINATKTALTAATVFAFTASVAFAQATPSGLGGLDTAKTTLSSIKNYLYAFLGVAAMIYLMYVAVQCFTEKKQWGDLGMAVVQVTVVGAIIVIGSWAWTLFGGSGL